MPRVNIHPGRELLQCARHRNAWYPRAAGCALCKAERRELSEASRDLAQAIRAADAANSIVSGFFARESDAFTRAFAVSDIGPAAILALVMTFAACGGSHSDATLVGDLLNGSPVLAESQLETLVVTAADEMPTLDARAVRFVIVDTIEDAFARCGWPSRACTHLPSLTLVAPWDLTPGNWPASTGTVRLAADGIAHELCHVADWQTGGTGDPRHENTDCFEGVVGRVVDAFVAAYGESVLAAAAVRP